ncbi:MAG TPA: Crp/Fnr family transcriptional regulator [Acidimicrobiales bacterium]|nr:Crp/Fnr family transcriptional regulator [Acidimicrobiales bacterium]
MDWNLLSALTPDERRSVLSLARRRKFKKGEVIFHEGDPGDTLHLIDKGHVAMRVTTPMGDVATLLVTGPGDFFGELAVVGQTAARNSTVVALDDCETLALHRDQVDELRRGHTAIDRVLIDALTQEVRRMSARLLEALYVPVDKRLYRRLADLGQLFAESGGGIPLTQEDLAAMAGTTRPTANRVVKAAEEAGLIRTARGRFQITNLDGLIKRGR